MLLRATFLSAWNHFSWLVLGHWFYVTLIIVYFFVMNGLKSEEVKRLTLVKEHYSLITTKSDKRKGNIFFSTPEYFLKLTELLPEVDAFLESTPIEMNFSYQQEGKLHHVKRELPLYLIGSGYFDAFEGRFIQGRGFTRSEVFSGKPMLVLTEGALIKIFGDYNRSPSMVWINGVEFQVIGTWAFNSSDIIENESILLPIGLTKVFGKDTDTYVNNFLLKGEDSRVLTKLKQAIDKIQMDSGYNPIRPEFSFVSPQVSRKTEFIFIHNKVYIDVFIWLIFLLYCFLSLKQNRDWMSFKQDWTVWTFMARGHHKTHARDAADFYFLVLTLSLIGAVISSLMILLFFKYSIKITLAGGELFHWSLITYIFFFPIQLTLLRNWSKKLMFIP